MVLEDKIAVNVAKFLAPLPPQDAPNPAVTAEMAQPPAPVVETGRPGRIVRNVPIAASVDPSNVPTVAQLIGALPLVSTVPFERTVPSHAHRGSMPTVPHQRLLPVAVLLPVVMAPVGVTVALLALVVLMLAVRNHVVRLLATTRPCSEVLIARSMTVSAT